jgi:hypothetical protein
VPGERLDQPPAREPAGLQPERTSLAWERTGLTFVAAGALLIRAVGAPYPDLHHVPGLIALVFGGVVMAARARRTAGATGPGGSPRLMLSAAIVTVQVSLGAFLEIAT